MRRRLRPFGCEVRVVWSFVYLALGRVLELIMLCCRSAEAKEVEILVCATSLQCCVASIRGHACNPRIVPCWRR
jgi:hypothetical protein